MVVFTKISSASVSDSPEIVSGLRGGPLVLSDLVVAGSGWFRVIRGGVVVHYFTGCVRKSPEYARSCGN